MTNIIPHKAFVVVADGTGARFFRNTGPSNALSLTAEGAFGPSDLENEGPSGHRPVESTKQETDEATFAKQLSHELYRRAHAGEFEKLVLIADPQTLGQMRPQLHKEVKDKIVFEAGKTLTKSSIKDIEKSFS